MAENTEISWCDHTCNAWWGCTEVHAGCDHCYARILAHRWGFEVWGAKGVRRVIKGFWKDLAKYQRKAAAAGVIRSVFIGSMMDIFEKPMPLVDDLGNLIVDDNKPIPDRSVNTGMLRERLFKEIDEGKYPNLLLLLLTKRPSNINKYIPKHWRKDGAPDNVMFGTSIVDQPTADTLGRQMLEVNGTRFFSMEPLIGPVNMKKSFPLNDGSGEWVDLLSIVEWVIVGGESTTNARPMYPEWPRSIRDQCLERGTKFHFKQWGEWLPGNYGNENWSWLCNDGVVLNDDQDSCPECVQIKKVGKKAAGRLLDGQEYNDTPLLIK